MPWERLSPEAVVVLRSLVASRAPTSAGQLCASTGLPVTVVALAIDELVAGRRVRVADDSTLVLQTEPDPPAAQAGNLDDDRRWQHRLTGAYDEDDPLLERIHGNQPTIDRIATLHVARPREVLSLSPRPSGPTQAPVNDGMVALLQAGGTSTWITDRSRIEHPTWQPLIRRHIGYGERIYSLPETQQRFLVFDRQVALLPLDPADHTKGSLLVRSPALVHHLVTLFHEILGRATPVVGDAAVTDTQRDVLTLVAAGLKDDAIARRLQVSPRTVRRAIAAAMRQSGAESRFQLAVAAVHAGWLRAGGVGKAQ